MTKILQSRTFEHEYKKFHKATQKEIKDVIKQIINDPQLGDLKVGDLKGVLVYKFKINKQTARLAYTIDKMNDIIYLISVGHRENFYDKIKRIIYDK